MKLITEVSIPEYPFQIDYGDMIFMTGSCFSENIGAFLHDYKFNIVSNPYGILYNPISICSAIEKICLDKNYTSSDLFQHNGLYHSFEHHGDFSSPSPEKTLEDINRNVSDARSALSKAKLITITLGTAFVYESISEKRIVANCHKLPDKEFKRYMLGTQAIVDSMQTAIATIRNLNPDVNFLLTVSPVRHLRDGLTENQRSKASLILAVNELCKEDDSIYYFPAFELIMDEFRDYRFYKEDLVHPNSLAIKLIWEKFSNSLISDQGRKTMKEVESITKAVSHRPINAGSAEHKKFIQNQLIKIEEMESGFPELDFKSERQFFESQSEA